MNALILYLGLASIVIAFLVTLIISIFMDCLQEKHTRHFAREENIV